MATTTKMAVAMARSILIIPPGLARAAGIEPTLTTWQAVVLPLYEARLVAGLGADPSW